MNGDRPQFQNEAYSMCLELLNIHISREINQLLKHVLPL